MADLAKAKRIYSAYLAYVETAVAGEANVDVFPCAEWLPPGEIRIIGAWVRASMNVLADSDLSKAGCYVYASLGMLPRMGGVNELVSAFAELDVSELPTVGEHGLVGARSAVQTVVFPEPLGIATNEWHAVYLNLTHRNLWAENVECAALARIFYVEL